ncbi:MAG: redoxin domain-containing protein [Woeseiaceae bacterium]|nr:redoxin domain-containing protein [Woeseiaceae bacterium]
MPSIKLEAGADFDALPVHDQNGDVVDISKPTGDADWQMVVVYRGQHCPMCTKFLNRLAEVRQRLLDIGVDIAAVSGDSKEQLESHLERLDVNFPLFYGLTEDQMKGLGLYISIPRSEQETDHNFPEPGLFVINGDGQLQVVDLSNNPFARPDVEIFVSGLEWIRNPENNYPIRGTASYS